MSQYHLPKWWCIIQRTFIFPRDFKIIYSPMLVPGERGAERGVASWAPVWVKAALLRASALLNLIQNSRNNLAKCYTGVQRKYLQKIQVKRKQTRISETNVMISLALRFHKAEWQWQLMEPKCPSEKERHFRPKGRVQHQRSPSSSLRSLFLHEF